MARTTEELLRLLADLETEQVERKESVKGGSVKDKICQAICAFSNDLPGHQTSGVVFVGVSDNGSQPVAGLTTDCCWNWPTCVTRVESSHHRS